MHGTTEISESVTRRDDFEDSFESDLDEDVADEDDEAEINVHNSQFHNLPTLTSMLFWASPTCDCSRLSQAAFVT